MPYDQRTPLDAITHRINGSAFKVQNTLGCGFLEKVYENALALFGPVPGDFRG
jgi:hypothetical protein